MLYAMKTEEEIIGHLVIQKRTVKNKKIQSSKMTV